MSQASQVVKLLLDLHNERALKEKYLRERNDFIESYKECQADAVALYKQVQEMQKVMQDIHDKLNNGASHEFEETIQYCITKAFYALKGVETK
jgi:hypothetical protein